MRQAETHANADIKSNVHTYNTERVSYHCDSNYDDQHKVSKQKQEQTAPATNLSAHVYSVIMLHGGKKNQTIQNAKRKKLQLHKD